MLETLQRILKGLSWSQIVAAAAAAVTALVLSTQIGVAGSVLGAAVSSLVSTVASTVYKNTLNEGARRLKNASPQSDGAKKAGAPDAQAGATPDSAGAAAAGGTATASLPYRSDGAAVGRGGRDDFDDGSADALASLDAPNTASFPTVAYSPAAVRADRRAQGAPADRTVPAPVRAAAQAGTHAYPVQTGSPYGANHARRPAAGSPYDAAPGPYSRAALSQTGTGRTREPAPTRSARHGRGRSGAFRAITTLGVGMVSAALALGVFVWAIDSVTSGNGWGIKSTLIRGTEEIAEKLDGLLGTAASSVAGDSLDTASVSSAVSAAADALSSAANEAQQAVGDAVSTVTATDNATDAGTTTTTQPDAAGQGAAEEQAEGSTEEDSTQTEAQGEGAGEADAASGAGTGPDADVTGADADVTGTDATPTAAA